ncbi:MAG: hypothetical protein WC905_01465 [Patescibacteria group bacterium]
MGVYGLHVENFYVSAYWVIFKMVIIGKQGCPRCNVLRTAFPSIKYIEIPSMHIGLGDTIYAIAHMFGIHPCTNCKIRRHWCNKIFPYKWNQKNISPEIVNLKQKIIISKIDQYPIVMDDELETIIPIEMLWDE